MLENGEAGTLGSRPAFRLRFIVQTPRITALLELGDDVIGHGVTIVLAEALPQTPDDSTVSGCAGRSTAEAMLGRRSEAGSVEPRRAFHFRADGSPSAVPGG